MVFCGETMNGEALASGLAVLVGEAGARSLASKTHRKNSHTEKPSASQQAEFCDKKGC